MGRRIPAQGTKPIRCDCPAYGLVVDYHGVSRDLEEALSSFDWAEVRDSMRRLEEDPGPQMESAAVQAESHFKGADAGDAWACVAVFAADGDTEGDYKADAFQRFNADYGWFSRLMDRYLPDPRALAYADRLARLTEIRAYARAQFLREDANLDWTEIGAKVKKLVDERISAEVRGMMKPLSILDKDFDEKIAALPHDEARASVMEHAIRAQISERLAENPVFYERLSERLAKIIRELRERLIESGEACRRMAELRGEIQGISATAAQHDMSVRAYSIYQLLAEGDGDGDADGVSQRRPKYAPEADKTARKIALDVEAIIERRGAVIDWASNHEAQREMRRDVKRTLRGNGSYSEARLDELSGRIVDMAGSGYDY